MLTAWSLRLRCLATLPEGLHLDVPTSILTRISAATLDVEKCSPARVTSLDIASSMASLSTPATFLGATVLGLGLFIALTSSLTTSGRNTGEAIEGRKESVEARKSWSLRVSGISWQIGKRDFNGGRSLGREGKSWLEVG